MQAHDGQVQMQPNIMEFKRPLVTKVDDMIWHVQIRLWKR